MHPAQQQHQLRLVTRDRLMSRASYTARVSSPRRQATASAGIRAARALEHTSRRIVRDDRGDLNREVARRRPVDHVLRVGTTARREDHGSRSRHVIGKFVDDLRAHPVPVEPGQTRIAYRRDQRRRIPLGQSTQRRRHQRRARTAAAMFLDHSVRSEDTDVGAFTILPQPRKRQLARAESRKAHDRTVALRVPGRAGARFARPPTRRKPPIDPRR